MAMQETSNCIPVHIMYTCILRLMIWIFISYSTLSKQERVLIKFVADDPSGGKEKEGYKFTS
eukprot:scaffold3962_cov68-Cylindrotheca_fusiformis.AAC.1